LLGKKKGARSATFKRGTEGLEEKVFHGRGGNRSRPVRGFKRHPSSRKGRKAWRGRTGGRGKEKQFPTRKGSGKRVGKTGKRNKKQGGLAADK